MERTSSPAYAWFRALAHWQARRPLWFLLAALLSVAGSAVLASKLTLKTSFGELLPENAESVRVAERVNEVLPTASTLTVVATGEDPEALERFVDALAPELRALGPDWVGNVDDGVRATSEFFRRNALLYAPLSEVEELHAEISSRWEAEVAKEAGFDLGLDDDEPEATDGEGNAAGEAGAIVSAAEVREKVEARIQARAEASGLPPQVARRGYYVEPDGRFIAVVVQTPVSIGDIRRGEDLQARIRGVIDQVGPTSFHPSIETHFTGDLITGAEEYNQIKSDLAEVGLLGVSLILAVVFLFYLRVRTLVAMTLTVGIGVAWTFGCAYLAVGHLNSSTGFLVSIVAGNGINFGIIYMARYLESRTEADVTESLEVAHVQTWVSTLAAALAAMVAYGSLIVTDFRGFKHFGIIGGLGMLLCWVATYLFLPPILAVAERVAPVKREKIGAIDRLRGLYGRPFAAIVDRAPRLVAVAGILAGLVGVWLSVRYVANDPMEYDLSQTSNERQEIESDARQLGRRVDKLVGRRGQDGIAILTDRVDQVLPLKAALDARRAAAPEGKKPFDSVVTIHSLLPSDQERKIELGLEARDRLERARRRELISDADWKELSEYLPGPGAKPIGIEDLPAQVVRGFVERDGTRGRLVYIVPASGRSVWDARYLLDWADSFRRTELPDGSVVQGSGKSVIFADMFLAVIADAPKAIILSLLGTLIVILIAFRGRAASWVVIATLLLGLSWMLAGLSVYGSTLSPLKVEPMRLNFLNFIALPISIGIGADYAVNVMQRYQLAGAGKIRTVIEQTGGAVILCSLTTMLGYLALMSSVNRAIQSFGVASALGELCCLLAGVLVLPAALAWWERRSRRAPS